MKVIIKILFFILILTFSFSCDKKDKKASAYLLKARNMMYSKEYQEARQAIDSINILYPNAYIQIRQSELLLDSIKREENRNRIDSLNDLKYSYERELRNNLDTNRISLLQKKIENIEEQKLVCKVIIDSIYDNELKAAARCQCKTALK